MLYAFVYFFEEFRTILFLAMIPWISFLGIVLTFMYSSTEQTAATGNSDYGLALKIYSYVNILLAGGYFYLVYYFMNEDETENMSIYLVVWGAECACQIFTGFWFYLWWNEHFSA